MKATTQERMEFSELFDLDSDEEEGKKKTKYVLFCKNCLQHLEFVIV